MRIGLATRALNGPESRALRTILHLERRNLTRIINATGVLGNSRCQNSDLTAWEVSEEGYPHALTRLLQAFDAAVSQTSVELYAAGSREAGVCKISRPRASDIEALISKEKVGVVLDQATREILMGDGGDVWQRLFDAVVARLAERCDRQGTTLVIGRSD